jgi:hypothetical protein
MSSPQKNRKKMETIKVSIIRIQINEQKEFLPSGKIAIINELEQ